EPTSKLNFGIRWRPIPDWVEIDASYQRGNTIGINIFMPFQIGRPMIPIYDHPYKEPPEFRIASLDLRIYRALMASGFGNIGVNWEGNDLIVDLENYKYFYPARAVEVAVSTLAPLLPDSVQNVTLIFKERDVPVYVLKTHREDMLLFKREKITWAQYLYTSPIGSTYQEVPSGSKFPSQGITLGYRPIFQLFLNDPSGFWKGKLGITGYASKKLWAGCQTTLGLSFYPLANISTVNEPLSIPVRTDIVDYIGRKFLFDSWVIDQVYRLPNTDLFLRGTFGVLELQYSGIDLEAAYPIFNGKIFLGTNMALVKKRDPKIPWEFRDDPPNKDNYRTTFLNLRVHLPFVQSYLDLKYGRFLAGDVGTKITATKVIRGVQISAWYSFTDTDVFSDNINRGYKDKGVSVTIPFRLFKGTDTRARYTQGISPWTRDVAQDINHFTPLFEFLEENTFFGIDNGMVKW
ncbi:MAG: YjbH domain-containing protein, partial [Desulfatiglandales bacterium]